MTDFLQSLRAALREFRRDLRIRAYRRKRAALADPFSK